MTPKKFLTSKLFISLFINIAFFAFTLFFTDLKNGTNDDPGIAALLAGAYGNFPEPKQFFINSLLGYFLYPLYLFVPSVNWFVISQLALSMFAFAGMTYVLLNRLDLFWGLLVSALIVGVGSEDAYVLYQWTKTTAICSYCGFFLLAEYVIKSKASGWMLVWGGLLIVFGAMLRWEAFLESLSFIWILFFILYWESKKEGAVKDIAVKKRKLLICFFALFSSLVFSAKFQQMTMSDENYAFYKSYNEARALVTDYIDVGSANIVYDKDYELFRSWRFYDPEIFSLDVVNSYKKQIREKPHLFWFNLKRALSLRVIERLIFYPVFILDLFLFVLIVCFQRQKSPFALLCFGMASLLYIYLFFRGRIVYRIEFVIWFGVAIIESWLFCQPKKNSEKMLLLLAFAALVAWKIPLYNDYFSKQMGMFREESSNNNVYDRRHYLISNPCPGKEDSLRLEMQAHPENLYLLSPLAKERQQFVNSCQYTSVLPGSLKNQIPLGSWLVYWPSVTESLKELGVENPLKSLVNDNVYVVGRAGVDDDALRQYLERHYYDRVTVRLVKSVDGVGIYKYEKVQ